MRQVPVLKLVTFAAIGLAAIGYLAFGVVGISPFNRPYDVTMLVSDSGGVFPRAQVTYRGVPVGSVSSLDLRPGGVAVHLAIDGGVRIPKNVEAVVSERSPAGEQFVDLRPRTQGAPYLHSGSTIAERDTRTPLPFYDLLVDLTRFSDTVDPKDLSTVADALATAFGGAGPDLQRLLDNSGELLQTLRRTEPATIDLLDSARTVLDTAVQHRADLRQVSASLSDLAKRLRQSDPQITALLDQGPGVATSVRQLLLDNRTALATLLSNLVDTGQIVVARLPGLRQTLIALPRSAGQLADTVRSGTVWFDLVSEGGPACDYGTPRRAPQSAAERPPYLYAYCDSAGPSEQQRGSSNAPRPPGDRTNQPPPGASGNEQAPTGDESRGNPPSSGSSAGAGGVTTYDPATGVGSAPDGSVVMFGTSNASGLHSLLDLLLVAVR